MKKSKPILIAVVIIISIFFISSTALSYWVWTPETKKFVNPKYAVRDTPKEQFDWSMVFYDKKDYKKAIFEFEKLVKNYSNSEFAPRAQYYVGRSHEEDGDLYRAFLSYQKVIDNFPYNDKVDEIIERQYKIGNLFYSGQKTRLIGMDLLPGLDKAAEIFQKVVANAPYGEYADLAQFKLGETYKKLGNYNEAIVEFQKLVDTYPSSRLADEARYQIALSAYKASLGADYDQETTNKAIVEFKSFTETHPESNLAKDVDATLKNLNEKKAASAFKTAVFYERIGKFESALIYYQEIIDEYPDSSFAKEATKAVNDLTNRINAKNAKKAPKRIPKESAKKVAEKKPEEAVVEKKETVSKEATKKVAKEPESALKEDLRSQEVFQKPEETSKEEEKEVTEKPKEKQKKSIGGFLSSLAFGYTAGSLLPPNIKTIYIDNFINKIDITTEATDVNKYKLYRSGLESDITNAVTNTFNKDGNLLIAKKKEADIRLYGELVNLSREALRYDTNDNIEEYRLYITVNLTMKNSKDETMWQETSFTGESTYTVVGSLAKSESSAIDDAIKDLAQRVLERTIEDW